MGFAPGVRDDLTAFARFSEAVLHAIAVVRRDHERMRFAGLGASTRPPCSG